MKWRGNRRSLPTFWIEDGEHKQEYAMKTRHLAVIGVVGVMLAGCGNTQAERALSGAGIGAGAGAVTTALTGGSVIAGAAIGSAAGAAIGVVTDRSQIDLGNPIWE